MLAAHTAASEKKRSCQETKRQTSLITKVALRFGSVGDGGFDESRHGRCEHGLDHKPVLKVGRERK